jgi:hypothetical protein
MSTNKKRKGFFEESAGIKSSIRVVFLVGTAFNILACTALIIVYIWMKLHCMVNVFSLGELLAFTGGLQAAFSGGKLVHQYLTPQNDPGSEEVPETPVVSPTVQPAPTGTTSPVVSPGNSSAPVTGQQVF